MLIALVVLSLVTYRIGRFLILDTLIDTPRVWVHQMLLGKVSPWREWVYKLITCPYCLTIWIAAVLTVIADLMYHLTAPVGVWLASAAGSLVVWQYVED